MIQLLISLIEWFAVTGLSLLGISYDPPSPCAAPQPAEFRQAVVWIPTDEMTASWSAGFASTDCAVGSDIRIHNVTPYFLTPSDRYDS